MPVEARSDVDPGGAEQRWLDVVCGGGSDGRRCLLLALSFLRSHSNMSRCSPPVQPCSFYVGNQQFYKFGDCTTWNSVMHRCLWRPPLDMSKPSQAVSDQLFFNRAVCEEFKGQISEVIKLEAPDENLYKVQAMKHLNKKILGSRWASFASSYELKQGDLVLFRCRGDSYFKALIFDPIQVVARH